MPTHDELRMLQSLPLDIKIAKTKLRIKEWVDYYDTDGVYVSFSGGKDSTVLLHIVRQYKKFNPGIRKAYKENHVQVEFSDGNLCVIMAKSASEIVKEGARQSNCVATYCDRVAQGRCIIAFVRKVECPDVNYYTMELLPDLRTCGIVQCRGYRNGDPTPEDRQCVDAFLQKYRAWFNTRPLACDKVQAIREQHERRCAIWNH